MRDKIGSYNEVVERNIGIISEADQQKIRNTTVGVVGVGGCGGLTSVLLAKMGFGKIIIYDNDRYEISNLNRQMLATMDTVGRHKADVAAEVLKLHNPYVEVEAHVKYLKSTEEIVNAFKDVHVIIITVDNMSTIVKIVRAAKLLNIPAIITGPFGWKCFVSVVDPNGMDYEAISCPLSFRKELTDDIVEKVNLFQRDFVFNTGGFTSDASVKMREPDEPIVTFAPVVNLASTTAVLELVKLLTGKGVTHKFPQYFTMDLLTGEGWSVQEVGMKSISTYKERISKK